MHGGEAMDAVSIGVLPVRPDMLGVPVAA